MILPEHLPLDDDADELPQPMPWEAITEAAQRAVEALYAAGLNDAEAFDALMVAAGITLADCPAEIEAVAVQDGVYLMLDAADERRGTPHAQASEAVH